MGIVIPLESKLAAKGRDKIYKLAYAAHNIACESGPSAANAFIETTVKEPLRYQVYDYVNKLIQESTDEAIDLE